MTKYPNANAIEFAVLHLLEDTLYAAGIRHLRIVGEVTWRVRVLVKRRMGHAAFQRINGVGWTR